MPPLKPTSIPSARPTGTPGRTALSKNTMGLKFMNRLPPKAATTTTAAPSASTPAAPAASTPAPSALTAVSAETHASEAPKKVKSWLGAPTAGVESQWVLPGSTVEQEGWGETAELDKFEVEDSYLPFLLPVKASESSETGGGMGGRRSYGGLNKDIEKLSAPPAPVAPPPGSSSTAAAPTSETDADADLSTDQSIATPSSSTSGFLRPAAFADCNDDSSSAVKGKGRAIDVASSANGKKYAQGARASSNASFNSLSSGGNVQRGKKRPSSESFDHVPRGGGGGGGLLAGLELGGETESGSQFDSGEGGGGGGKKGRYLFDNSLRKEGGLGSVGRQSPAGGGKKKKAGK